MKETNQMLPEIRETILDYRYGVNNKHNMDAVITQLNSIVLDFIYDETGRRDMDINSYEDDWLDDDDYDVPWQMFSIIKPPPPVNYEKFVCKDSAECPCCNCQLGKYFTPKPYNIRWDLIFTMN